METAALRLALAQGTPVGKALSEGASPFATTGQLLAEQREITASLQGLTPQLAKLLELPGLTDLLINEPGRVWVDQGHGLRTVPLPSLQNPSRVRELAVRMAGAAGARLDEASPIVDANLPGGLRLHAILPPLCGNCAVISLRLGRTSPFSMSQLQESGMFDRQIRTMLERLVAARASILISGSTGCGKTTLLATLLGLVSHQERLICIEEVSELRPAHPHVVHLQSRAANVQQRGAVCLSELVKAAMRMRPDRLVLGEARGEEVREMLCALNTGHQGGMATIHANSAQDVPARLEALGALSNMDRQGVCAQAVAAFDIVIHLGKSEGAPERPTRRWVQQIAVLRRGSDGFLTCEVALSRPLQGPLTTHQPWPSLANKLGLTSDLAQNTTGSGAEVAGSKTASEPQEEGKHV